MQWLSGLALVLTLTVAAPVAALAASWGGIEPGVTTLEQVRERYGAPSNETKQKVEGYDTTTWVYEGAKAPVGMTRMTVDLGMLKPDGFKPDLVRVFALEPKPTIFPMQAIIDGWGLPNAAGEQGGFPTMLYESGLIVVFEKEGQFATGMTFTVPQPFQPPTTGAAPAPCFASPVANGRFAPRPRPRPPGHRAILRAPGRRAGRARPPSRATGPSYHRLLGGARAAGDRRPAGHRLARPCAAHAGRRGDLHHRCCRPPTAPGGAGRAGGAEPDSHLPRRGSRRGDRAASPCRACADASRECGAAGAHAGR